MLHIIQNCEFSKESPADAVAHNQFSFLTFSVYCDRFKY